MYTLREALAQGKVIPNKDISNDTITENSFAVGFNAVIQGTGAEIYTNPDTFFSLTHMTKNLSGIITQVLRRVQYGEGSPLQVLDTSFGGGKTHTLVTLYHLFKHPESAMKNPEISKIVSQLELEKVPNVALVAIDGHRLSSVERDGKVRTVWGEMARQLGQYPLMEVFDKKLRRPDAETLETLIESSGKPVIILLDELVNYLKDARGEESEESYLPDTTEAFFHTLTEVVANSKNAMLILTLPGTEAAFKRESELMEKYKQFIREIGVRESAFTVPMERSEIYDVARKRLFDFVDPTVASSVAEELLKFYGTHPEHFSKDIFSLDYRDKIIKSYPFHPQLIDLLYERIATIPEFQKTRSMLRILSYVMKNINQNIKETGNDPIIIPALVDLNDPVLLQEFTSKIAKNEYQNVVGTDIVNDESSGKCQKIDNNKKAFGSMTRIATAIYLYSLIGTTKEASLGCSANELILASACEGYAYPKDILNDAQNLEKKLWYIYEKNGKYFFQGIANLNKIIADEMTEYNDESLYNPEIKTRLRKLLSSDFFDVRVWEEDIRNPHKPTLAVPHYRLIKGSEGKVPDGVQNLISREGTSFRTKKNLMFVLVAMDDRVERMGEAAQRYLAISKLKSEQKSREDLKSFGSKLDELLKEADTTLNLAIERCYSLIYYPKGTDVKFITVANGYEKAQRYPDKIYQALVKSQKIVENLNPEYIVDRVMGNRAEVMVRDLWATFEEVPIHMLPANTQILQDAINKGLENKLFGVYTGGVGDLQLITSKNYQKVGEQFFYGRTPQNGTRDGHYILLKDQARTIEEQLQALVKASEESGGKVVKEHKAGGGAQQTIVKIVAIEKPEQLKEYTDWIVKDIGFSFNNTHLFQPVKQTIMTLLLGVTGVTFTVDIQSRLMQFSVKDTAISDIKEFLEAITSIAEMFDEDLKASLTMQYSTPAIVDQSYADCFNDVTGLCNEIRFKANLEMAGDATQHK